MKILGGVALILLFAVMGWAQAGKADCAELVVTGPAGVHSPGEEMRYTLSLKGETAGRSLEFVWTTSNGKVIRGQGTREAVVGEWRGDAVVVTVEVKGLPAGCPRMASESMSYDPPRRAYFAGCPRITVLGPAGTLELQAPVPFTLAIEGEREGSVSDVIWTASNGRVVRGSDPRQITVAEWDYHKNLTVTAEVKGLPAGCPGSASETMGVTLRRQAQLVDEFGPAAFAAVKEYLLDSAAKDFHEHQPPYPAKFRRVRIGHLGDRTKSGYYRLCGEFLPAGGGKKAVWTKFATVKTSGYEQYLGSTNYCTDRKIKWDTKRDLAAVLKDKLDALKAR